MPPPPPPSQDDDPFLQVQADVLSTLSQTRPLFSSYLRIRSLLTTNTSSSATTTTVSPELRQSRNELLSTITTLSADLADLVDAVAAVEADPYRFGLDVDEVGRRREFVREVGGEVETMRREIEGGEGANGFSVGGLGFRGKEEDERGQEEGEEEEGEEGGLQQQMMQDQDEQLDGVYRTVGNLRTQAEDMGRELEEQGGMLDEVDVLADRVGGKLQSGVKKVGVIIRKNEDTVSSCCIAVLIFVLILLLILVIVL